LSAKGNGYKIFKNRLETEFRSFSITTNRRLKGKKDGRVLILVTEEARTLICNDDDDDDDDDLNRS
jgi:hypothetical protein